MISLQSSQTSKASFNCIRRCEQPRSASDNHKHCNPHFRKQNDMGREIVKFDRWLELPSDLLLEIVKHIHSSKDYVRFRAVCKSWNLDLPKIPNHIRGPWLVLPFNDETFDIEEKDFYLRLPEMRNNFLRGSAFGWLVSVETDAGLRMLNPFTKAQLHLPPLPTFPNIVYYRPDMTDQDSGIYD